MISSLRKLAFTACTLQARPLYRFGDNWKDRDEAAEKVYINQHDSTHAST